MLASFRSRATALVLTAGATAFGIGLALGLAGCSADMDEARADEPAVESTEDALATSTSASCTRSDWNNRLVGEAKLSSGTFARLTANRCMRLETEVDVYDGHDDWEVDVLVTEYTYDLSGKRGPGRTYRAATQRSYDACERVPQPVSKEACRGKEDCWHVRREYGFRFEFDSTNGGIQKCSTSRTVRPVPIPSAIDPSVEIEDDPTACSCPLPRVREHEVD